MVKMNSKRQEVIDRIVREHQDNGTDSAPPNIEGHESLKGLCSKEEYGFPALNDKSDLEKNSFRRNKLENDIHHVNNVHSFETRIDLTLAIDAQAEQLNAAKGVVDCVLLECAEYPEKLFTKEFTDAVRLIRESDQGLWASYRVKLRRAKPSGVLLSEIDKATLLGGDESEGANDSIASELIELVLDSGNLFFDTDADRAYLYGQINGLATTLALDSKGFIEWLSFAYYIKTKVGEAPGKSASELALKQARFALTGIAKHEGAAERVYIRTASVSSGQHFIFMGDEQLRAIEVNAAGWRIAVEYPVKFWNPLNMRALPLPQAGGDYSLLWKYANVSESDRILVLAWMLECYRSETPNPILLLTGGQGCAKSSTQNKLRVLIDNNAVNLRTRQS